MLRLAMGKPWRQTEGMLRSLVHLLELDIRLPDHTTFSRRSPGLSLTTVMIPIEVGHGFRCEAGHCSGMKPAIIPR